MPKLGRYTKTAAPDCANGQKGSDGMAPREPFEMPKKRGGPTTKPIFTRQGQPYSTSNTKFGPTR